MNLARGHAAEAPCVDLQKSKCFIPAAKVLPNRYCPSIMNVKRWSKTDIWEYRSTSIHSEQPKEGAWQHISAGAPPSGPGATVLPVVPDRRNYSIPRPWRHCLSEVYKVAVERDRYRNTQVVGCMVVSDVPKPRYCMRAFPMS